MHIPLTEHNLKGTRILQLAPRLLLLIAWAAVIVQASLFLKDSLILDSQQIGRKILLIPMVIGLLAAAVVVIIVTYRKNPLVVRYWLIAILCLAAVLRLSWALAFPTIPISDFDLNHNIALALSENQVEASFSRNIGYPVLLSIVYRIYPDPLSGRLLNVAFSIMSVYLVYLLAATALDPLAGLLSAFFMTLSTPDIMMTSVLGTEVITLTFLLSGFFGLLKIQQNPNKLGWAVFAGLGLGLALLFRPVIIVYLPIFLAGLLLANKQRTNFWKLLFIFLGCIFAVHMLMVIWHSLSIESFSTKSINLETGPYTIISGTNIESKGYFNNEDADLYWSWPEEERTQRSLALAYHRVVSNPGGFAALVGLKMNHLFANDTYGLQWSLYPLDTAWTPLQLELLRLRGGVIAQTLYVIMLVAGFYYFSRVSFAKSWLPLVIASAIVLSVLPFILTEAQPRYHHVMLGFMALAAGCGIFEGQRRSYSQTNT